MISNRIAARVAAPVTAAVDRMEARLIAKIEAACKPEPTLSPDWDDIVSRLRSLESVLRSIETTVDNAHSLTDDVDDRTREMYRTIENMDFPDTDDLEGSVDSLRYAFDDLKEEIQRNATAIEELREAVRTGSALTFKVEVVRDRTGSALPVAAL